MKFRRVLITPRETIIFHLDTKLTLPILYRDELVPLVIFYFFFPSNKQTG